MLSFVITGVVEYLTGFWMLEVYHRRWWDYTGLFLNIDGFVCFRSVFTFAIAALALIYVFVPLIDKLKDAGIKLIPNPESWHKEYSDKILAYKFVSSVEEAVNHINTYSSGHTDGIITESKDSAEYFLSAVDSAGVYHNVSTRFADGFRYGFGAEVGISTNKTHARGPVGLEGLTIYKYTLEGGGQIVKDYVEVRKSFTHKDLI